MLLLQIIINYTTILYVNENIMIYIYKENVKYKYCQY